MKRDICKVIDNIYDLIPHNDNSKLKFLMDDLISSMQYAAPEKIQSNYYWFQLSNILNGAISVEDYNNKDKPYFKEIINIFTNKI